MINVYNAPNELTAPLFAKAFKSGARQATICESYRPGPWAGFGSPTTWETLQEARRAGFDFYYGDHAYFGRGRSFRITKNAYQHNGLGAPDFNRLSQWHDREVPWRKGKNIIVCVQSEAFHDRMGCKNWLFDTLARLRANTDRPIVVRSKKIESRLEEDLEDGWCVVTHASNAAVVGLMNGVPAICTGDCAAGLMSLRDPANVEYPYYPENRLHWAAVLAANQWTLQEIAEGKAWRSLNAKV